MHLLEAGRTGDAGAPEPVAGPASQHSIPVQARYSLRLLRATHRGLLRGQTLVVTVKLRDGRIVYGHVLGIGSRLGVVDADNQLHEDISAEWVTHATIVDRPMR